MTAHLLRPFSILVSLLWMRKWGVAWESHTGLWPTPAHCSRWVRQPTGENGSGQGGNPWRLKPTPRALYHQRDNGPTTHVISYLDELAVHIPTLESWDQMVWPTMAAIPRTLTEAEFYGYCWGQAVDLDPVMPAAQFQVTEERGAYLCTVRALAFEGSILAYNPALNEAEWMPVCGLANDLSWAEERSTVALANYVPCTPAEAAWIARLGAGRIVSCPSNDSSTSTEEEEAQHSDTQSTNPTTDTDPEVGDESEDGVGGQTNTGDAAERD